MRITLPTGVRFILPPRWQVLDPAEVGRPDTGFAAVHPPSMEEGYTATLTIDTRFQTDDPLDVLADQAVHRLRQDRAVSRVEVDFRETPRGGGLIIQVLTLATAVNGAERTLAVMQGMYEVLTSAKKRVMVVECAIRATPTQIRMLAGEILDLLTSFEMDPEPRMATLPVPINFRLPDGWEAIHPWSAGVTYVSFMARHPASVVDHHTANITIVGQLSPRETLTELADGRTDSSGQGPEISRVIEIDRREVSLAALPTGQLRQIVRCALDVDGVERELVIAKVFMDLIAPNAKRAVLEFTLRATPAQFDPLFVDFEELVRSVELAA